MKKFFRNVVFVVVAIVVGCTIGTLLLWLGVLLLKVNEGLGITICLASVIIGPLIGGLAGVWIEEKIR